MILVGSGHLARGARCTAAIVDELPGPFSGVSYGPLGGKGEGGRGLLRVPMMATKVAILFTDDLARDCGDDSGKCR